MTYARVTRILCAAVFLFGGVAPNLVAQATQEPQTTPAHQPTAAELSHNETVGTALMRTFGNQEYEFRSAAEAMPADKYDFRPVVQGKFTEPAPFGPTELRTFAEQIKHVACANFAFAAEFDGKTPPPNCDKGGPSPAKTRAEPSPARTCTSPSKVPMPDPIHAWASRESPFGMLPITTARWHSISGSTASSRRPAAQSLLI